MAVAISQTANPAGAGTGTTITYEDQIIGAADQNRFVVVCVGAELTSASPTSATINSGSGAVAMTAGTLGSQGNVYSRIFYKHVPTGTTADIAITFAATQGATTQRIAVYRVVGGAFHSQNGLGDTDADPISSGPVTIPTDGGSIAICSMASDGTARTWAGITKDIDTGTSLTFRFTTAFTTTAGTPTFTVSGGNNEDGALSLIVFKPGYTVDVAGGTFALAGSDVDLLHVDSRELAAEGGAFGFQIADLVTADWGLTATGGTLEFTGSEVDLVHSGVGTLDLPAEGGELEVSGSDVSLVFGTVIAATGGTFEFYLADDITVDWGVVVDGGEFELSGSDASLEIGLNVAAEGGGLTLDGSDVDLVYILGIDAEGGTLEFSGTEVLRQFEFVATGGALTLSGTAVDLEHVHGDYQIDAEGGTLTFQIADEVLAHWGIAAAVGSLALSGSDAGLEYQTTYGVSVAGGTFEFSGYDAFRALELAVSGGELTLTGSEVDLDYSGTTYLLPAEGGGFTFVGSESGLIYGAEGFYVISAEGGEFNFQIADEVTVDRGIVAGAGALTLTGSAASLEYGYEVVAEGGTLALSGSEASLEYGFEIAAEGGTFALSGSEVTLTYDPAAFVMDAGTGSYILSGSDVELEYSGATPPVAEVFWPGTWTGGHESPQERRARLLERMLEDLGESPSKKTVNKVIQSIRKVGKADPDFSAQNKEFLAALERSQRAIEEMRAAEYARAMDIAFATQLSMLSALRNEQAIIAILLAD